MKDSLKFLAEYPTFSIENTSLGELPIIESGERLAYLEKRASMLDEILPHLLAVCDKIPFIIESEGGAYFTFYKPVNFRVRLEILPKHAAKEISSGNLSRALIERTITDVKNQVMSEIATLKEVAI